MIQFSANMANDHFSKFKVTRRNFIQQFHQFIGGFFAAYKFLFNFCCVDTITGMLLKGNTFSNQDEFLVLVIQCDQCTIIQYTFDFHAISSKKRPS